MTKTRVPPSPSQSPSPLCFSPPAAVPPRRPPPSRGSPRRRRPEAGARRPGRVPPGGSDAADDHRRPDPRVPDHARVRSVDHRLLGRRSPPAGPAARDAVMRDLFDPKRGDGLGVLRQPMGASDFVDGDFYTYDDVRAGKTDYAMEAFTIAHDGRGSCRCCARRRRSTPPSPWSRRHGARRRG